MPRTTRRATPPKQAGRPPQLTDKQRLALAAELNGKSVEDAAKEAGVSRQTVSEWRNHDPDHRAARNAAAWDQLGDLTMHVRRTLLPQAFADIARDLRSEEDSVRQRARADLLRYERQLPEPPPADPDLERDADAWRSFKTGVIDVRGEHD